MDGKLSGCPVKLLSGVWIYMILFEFWIFSIWEKSNGILCGDIWWCFPLNNKWKHTHTYTHKHGYQRARLWKCVFHVSVCRRRIFHIHTHARILCIWCLYTDAKINTVFPHTHTHARVESEKETTSENEKRTHLNNGTYIAIHDICKSSVDDKHKDTRTEFTTTHIQFIYYKVSKQNEANTMKVTICHCIGWESIWNE